MNRDVGAELIGTHKVGSARLVAALVAVFAALLVAGTLTLVVARSAEAAFPGDNGEIIFSSDRTRNAQDIFAISPAGGEADRLTTFTTGHNIDPAVSPDGSRIAFSRGNQIWVMTADGTGATQITNTSTAKTKPAWSPDGSRIAYVANSSDVDGQTDLEIWAINADGSGRTQLTNNTVPDDQPAWSPDGTQIAFVSTRTGDNNRNIYVMDANGNNQTDITQDGPYEDTTYQGHDDHPSWSPDGLTIAYTHTFLPNASGVANVWTMSPTGAGKDNLQNDQNTSGSEPAWSPDGDKIAYVGVAPSSTNRDIHMMDANGANQKTVETGGDPGHDISPDWQPNPPDCDIEDTAGTNVLNGTPADETICGLGGNDVINGGGGNDILLGGGGNDTLVNPAGRATLNGGDGTDTASFAGSATDIQASLIDNFAQRIGTTPLEGAALVGIERLTGSGLDDVLEGSNQANKLVGGAGSDTLLGLGGKDNINSRDGVNRNDTVNGGAGTDRCTTDRREASIKSC